LEVLSQDFVFRREPEQFLSDLNVGGLLGELPVMGSPVPSLVFRHAPENVRNMHWV